MCILKAYDEEKFPHTFIFQSHVPAASMFNENVLASSTSPVLPSSRYGVSQNVEQESVWGGDTCSRVWCFLCR